MGARHQSITHKSASGFIEPISEIERVGVGLVLLSDRMRAVRQRLLRMLLFKIKRKTLLHKPFLHDARHIGWVANTVE